MITLRDPITITVKRPAERVRGGDKAGPDTDISVSGCAFWADQATEDTDRRDTTIVTGSLAVPRATDLRPDDRVAIPPYGPTNLFDVVGVPQWDNDSALSGNDFGLKVVQVRGVF